ncbi:glycoside hydrolase family 16 protein [Ramaria rubella]|nr:glycoside hydrolase family 16 protein [Ramaria rubella]
MRLCLLNQLTWQYIAYARAIRHSDLVFLGAYCRENLRSSECCQFYDLAFMWDQCSFDTLAAMIHLNLATLVLGLFVTACNAATYSRTDSISGTDFLSEFSHQAIADPTHGRVNYLSQADALAQNLTFASGDTFIMRADFTTVLDPSGPGRNSVRIQSNNQFSTHVIIMDIRHMPEGCSTWPAAWEVGDDWPNNGEVDIVEGVNSVTPNQATLHTSAGCTMPATVSTQTGYGTTVSTDCDANDNNNAGCGVKSTDPNSFAAGFNSAGGGWYAMERTTTEIRVWFWSRTDGSVPSDVQNAPTSIDTSTWGTPFADFPDTDCDLASHFGPNNVVVDLTFCGDFAGAVFTSDGCGADCDTFVNENPSAFVNAFWDFASMNIYQ